MKTKGQNGFLLLSVIGVLATLVFLIVLGNVIVIGDKIYNVSPPLAWVFYIIIVALFIWAIILPIVRIVITPPLNGFGIRDIDNLSPEETTEVIRSLKKNIVLTREEDKELRKSENRKLLIGKILKRRYEEMESAVKAAAVSNFVITAVSQNGAFDFISSMVINLRMINAVIRKLGIRPSSIQVLKLYATVMSSSLIITSLDNILDDMDFGELIGGLGVLGGQITKLVVPSATNGLLNALVTLRVGYTTIKYLEVGNRSFDKSETIKWAIKSARKQIINVGKEGMAQIIGKIGQVASRVL